MSSTAKNITLGCCEAPSDRVNKVISAKIEITNNDTHEVVAVYKSNSKTGKYLITLPFYILAMN